MADILVFPNISFDETDVGAREISPAAGNRIGVVGRFLKGPRNKFQVIDRQMLPAKYGKTKDNGSIAIQTAGDQGADDFGVVRVMGSGINAGAYLEFNLPDGVPAIATREKLTLLGTAFKVPFLGSGVTSANTVAQNFANGIRARFAGFEATVDGSTVTISTSIPEALDLPIKLLVRERANQNNSEANSGITAKYAEVASQFAQGAGTEIFDSSTHSSRTFRLSNGSIAIKFSVNPDIASVNNSNKSAFVHVMLGADVETEANVTTIQTIVEKLSKSVLDRRLGFTTEQLVTSPRQLFLRTRIEDQGEGNSCKFILARESLVNGVSVDSNLTLNAKTAEYSSSLSALAAGAVSSFGGAVSGPAPGVLTVRRQKFIRASIVATVANELSGTPAVATTKDIINFSAGEVTLGTDDKFDLANLSVKNIAVQQASSVAIILEKQNGVFTLISKSVNDPVGPGIRLGVYNPPSAASPANSDTGSFVADAPVNGDVLRIVAASEGSWSRNVSVSVIPGSDNLITVNLSYTDLFAENALDEKYDVYLDQVGVLDESSPYPMVVATRESSIAQIFYVGDNEENKKAVIQGISELLPQPLSGSSDGPDPSTADWIEAIRVMGQNPVNILIASGSTLPQVRNALIKQAEESDETTGLRIAVLSADRRLTPQAARTLTQYMDSKHAVMVGGHVTYSGRSDLMPLSVSPDGFYAGHLAATPIHVSPAGRTSSPAFKYVTAVDIPSPGTLAYNEYTKARIEMIIPDQVSGSFHCLNGRSLSKDPAWYWISLRRTYNYIRSNAFSILQFAKSEPNSAQLRSRVSSSISNFMYLMRAAGQIESVVKIQADDENNTAKQVAAGILRVDIYFVPVYPADFIKVGIHRVVPISLETRTGV